MHPVAASALSPASLKQQLRDLYTQDYIRHWHDLLAGAAVVPYGGCGDAARKLSVLNRYDSPVLALLLMTAENTTFSRDSPSNQAGIAAEFQPAHAIFDSSPPDRSRRVDRSNETYLKSLVNLERAMQALDRGGQCDSSDGVARDRANRELSSALTAVAEFEGKFNRVDTYNSVRDLLEGPILAAQDVISHASTSREDGRSAKKAQ
jgi:type VI protein secretion system component VasK